MGLAALTRGGNKGKRGQNEKKRGGNGGNSAEKQGRSGGANVGTTGGNGGKRGETGPGRSGCSSTGCTIGNSARYIPALHLGLFSSIPDPNPCGVGAGVQKGGGTFLNALFHSKHFQSTQVGGKAFVYTSPQTKNSAAFWQPKAPPAGPIYGHVTPRLTCLRAP